jgi:hypothetical protein
MFPLRNANDATGLDRGVLTFAATKKLLNPLDATGLPRGVLTFAATQKLGPEST